MSATYTYNAVVVGAGPNGLAAAIELARNGRSVAVLEANDRVGGGARSAELTIPGFVHDLGSAIHPLGFASPFFRGLPLGDHGLEWVHPAAPLAHPFDDGTATVLEYSVEETAGALGVDADIYRKLMRDVAEDVDRIAASFLGRPQVPRHPMALVRTGLRAAGSARGHAKSLFTGEKARGLFAGNAAHSFLPLERRPTAMFGFVNGVLGHARGYGWPFPKGGSQKIADALASYLLSLGGEISTGVRVTNVDEVPRTRAVLFDVTPRQLLSIAGKHFTGGYRRALRRYRYGPRRLQGGLCAGRPDPLEGQRVPARRDDPPRWDARGDSRRRSRRLARRAPRASVRPAGPTEPLRPDARPGRKAHPLGLLPRPPRLNVRHERADKGPDRTLRPRL
jgi:phytoene dehydrogenase-like protein